MNVKPTILFLVSGGGGNLQFIYHAIKKLNLNVEICGVIADRNCNALKFALQKNISSQQISYSINNKNELQNVIHFYKPDIIITTVHKIIDEQTLLLFSNIQFINLHYSLLPDFKKVIGMKAIEMAKSLNHKRIGATVHEVEKEVDAGKMIAQGKIEIENWANEKNEILMDTIFKTGCILLLNAILIKAESLTSSKNIIYQLNEKSVLIMGDVIHTKLLTNQVIDVFTFVKSL